VKIDVLRPWPIRAALALTIPLILLLTIVGPVAAQQKPPVDPRAIALTPADLPPGFAFVPDQTVLEPLPGGFAIQLKTELQREATLDNLMSGPIMVAQIIIRVDRLVVPADFLAEVRNSLIQNQGFQPVPGAPNDGGTTSLSKAQGDVVVYAVGFVKNEMVIFTLWGGLPEVVNLPGVLTLAGISSARYDAQPR
jgi:hypothetical protein